MNWLELSLIVERDGAERIGESLSESGALSVTFADAADDPVYEPAPGAAPLWNRTRVSALFDNHAIVDQALASLSECLGSAALPDHRIEPLAEQPWEQAWRDDYQPIDCGDGLWVAPEGFELPADARTVVRIEPGLAFGTGTHPTTAACLRWVASQQMTNSRVIDFGCGSGILGIAALLRGAARVWAVDHEPQALTATCANAERNGVLSQVETLASAEGLPKDADVLIANILLNPLLELKTSFAAHVRTGTKLALSGVLAEQADALCEAYEPWFDAIHVHTHDGWALVTARRR